MFPMTDNAEEEFPQSPRRRPTRRLVLVFVSTGTPQSVQDRVASPDSVPIAPHRDEEADGIQEPGNHVEEENSTISDTDSVASPQAGSDVSDDEVPDSRAEPDVEVLEPRLTPAIRAAFAELDGVDLRVEFNRRVSVMKIVPHFLRGSYRRCDWRWRKQHIPTLPDRNVGGGCFCCQVAFAPPSQGRQH